MERKIGRRCGRYESVRAAATRAGVRRLARGSTSGAAAVDVLVAGIGQAGARRTGVSSSLDPGAGCCFREGELALEPGWLALGVVAAAESSVGVSSTARIDQLECRLVSAEKGALEQAVLRLAAVVVGGSNAGVSRRGEEVPLQVSGELDLLVANLSTRIVAEPGGQQSRSEQVGCRPRLSKLRSTRQSKEVKQALLVANANERLSYAVLSCCRLFGGSNKSSRQSPTRRRWPFRWIPSKGDQTTRAGLPLRSEDSKTHSY